MKSNDYTIKITFAPNDDFAFTTTERWARSVVVSDQLLKPNDWDSKVGGPYMGAWSRRKHQFMIDVTGYRWDNEFVANEWTNWLGSDQSITMGITRQMQKALQEYEAEHGQMIDENGDPVAFDGSLAG